MGDIYVESYKKSVTNILDHWKTKLADLAKKLDPINDQIAALKKNTNPSNDDKKKLADLIKQRDDLRKQVENASLSLNVNLKIIEVDPKANPKEVKLLPDWMEKIVKDKGLPIGDDATLVPDVDFDLKSFKLKKFTLSVKWKF